MNTKLCVALLGGAATLSLTGAAQEGKEADDEPLRCLSMSSIRQTKIVDDSTVLFYQGGSRVYVNRLDRECVGLARSGTFTYQVQSGARYVRLCESDSITVLEAGGRGFNCGLGRFEPLSPEEAESFVRGPNRAVTSAPVEPPKSDEPEAAPAPEPEPPPQ